jgi:predicted lipoprotein
VKALAYVLLLFLWACTVSLGDGERRITARELTLDVVLPTLDEVVVTAQAQAAAMRAFVADPTDITLAAAQAAWRAARVPWKHTDAFGFGPAKDMSLSAAIDQVIDPAKVELEVNGTTAISTSYVETLGANRKGFHAIEHLLFASLASLTTEPDADRRRALLVAYAENLAQKAIVLRDAWAAGYARQMAEPGSGNEEYATIKAVIDTFTNESLFQVELISDSWIGKPMGTATGGVPQPELVESGPSDNSITDITHGLVGIRNIYFGALTDTPGKGIGKLVVAQSPAVDRDVRLQMIATLAAVEAIPRPYVTSITQMHPQVATAYEQMKELKRIFATEVVGVLGATLKFNDNDGD